MTQMEVVMVCSTTALWIWILLLEDRLTRTFGAVDKALEEIRNRKDTQ